MKGKKIFIIGFIIGSMVSMNIQAFGASTINKIEAYVNHQMTFTFDGVKKEVPADYTVVVYNNRSYVPVRFVAENLGGTVNWNDETKVIEIKSNTTTNEGKVESKYDYKKIPLYKENTNFKMAVTLLTEDDYGKKLNVTLENKTDTPIQLDQMATIIEIDGKEYTMKDSSIAYLDTRWYKDLAKEEKTEGYVRLPNNIFYEDVKNMHVVFKVNSNRTINQQSENMNFDISL